MSIGIGSIVQVSRDIFDSGLGKIVAEAEHCKSCMPGQDWDFIAIEVKVVGDEIVERNGSGWRFKREELK